MAFSYYPGGRDEDHIRLWIGDTEESMMRFSDEELTALIASEGSWQKAAVACCVIMQAKLSMPNFTADWLTVSHDAARVGWAALETQLRRQFNVAKITASVIHRWRPDSDQTEAPNYDA